MTLIAATTMIASIAAAVAAIFSYLAIRRTRRLERYLELSIKSLRDETLPLIRDAASNISRSEDELEKLESLIDSTAIATEMMHKTSRAAFSALTSPIVKVRSLQAGSRAAASVLRTKKERK
ncbi:MULTISPECIES: hypothetical protein [Acidithrix]|uniref:DUF948 domain-containing protein n=1 Tax=Acidithrix ferrooxidans TaxID=1280514 RepID=A0A0D8HGJ7_9ACTN|nr:MULTISPECIES: hypothetical protein [Acidithrix]KJF16882.1 hypothetical protein AXFE_23030 [Acidithrix ferrooxidans]CAG4931977.1 unnamed protein product [Acidithrix sp. C25]